MSIIYNLYNFPNLEIEVILLHKQTIFPETCKMKICLFLTNTEE